MRIKIVTLYDDAMSVIGNITSEINRQYAQIHGYDFVCYRNLPNPNIGPQWNKLSVIQQEISSCDWILWIDADAVFVNKQRTLVELFQSTVKPMLISSDSCGICTGAFALKNCAWSVQLLTTWLFLGEMSLAAHQRFSSNQLWEQHTFKAILGDFSNVYENVDIVSDAIIQNPDSTFCPDAMIMHYWYSGMGRRPVPIVAALQALRENGGQYTPACRPPKQ